jgi:hypothetical protein
MRSDRTNVRYVERDRAIELVNQLTAIDIALADVQCCTQVLHDLSRLIAWAESHKLAVANGSAC